MADALIVVGKCNGVSVAKCGLKPVASIMGLVRVLKVSRTKFAL